MYQEHHEYLFSPTHDSVCENPPVAALWRATGLPIRMPPWVWSTYQMTVAVTASEDFHAYDAHNPIGWNGIHMAVEHSIVVHLYSLLVKVTCYSKKDGWVLFSFPGNIIYWTHQTLAFEFGDPSFEGTKSTLLTGRT